MDKQKTQHCVRKGEDKWDFKSVYVKPHEHIKQCYMQCYIFKYVNQKYEKGCLQGEQQMLCGSEDWEKRKKNKTKRHLAQTDLLWNEEDDDQSPSKEEIKILLLNEIFVVNFHENFLLHLK